jgi:hypothetical protein
MDNYSGVFYMAVQKDDGNASIVNLEDYGSSFVIEEATNTKTGEAVNTTEVQTYTYETTDASQLQEEIDRLHELRAEYEEQVSAASGGDSSSGMDTQTLAVAALLGAVAVLYVKGRDENR